MMLARFVFIVLNFTLILSFSFISNKSFAQDCNQNGEADLIDIESGGSEDCNANGIPDECEEGEPRFDYQAPKSIEVGREPNDLQVGDFNGDLKPDLAVLNFRSQDVSILLATELGQYELKSTQPVGDSPSDIVVGDFNNDQHTDFGVAIFNVGINLFFGKGNGTFDRDHLPLDFHRDKIHVADFNQDGNLDFIFGARDSDETRVVIIYTGDGEGGFDFFEKLPGGNVPVVGDFNNDGRQDLAVTHTGESIFFLYFAEEDGTYRKTEEVRIRNLGDLIVGHFNEDDHLDIAAPVWPNNINVLLNQGDESFEVTNIEIPSFAEHLSTGDVNSDGHLDLVCESAVRDSVYVLKGNGQGEFTFIDSIFAGRSARSHVLVDTNQDGFLDVVTGNSGANDITIIRGRGVDGFEQENRLSAGNRPGPIALADFTNDGIVDLVISHENESIIKFHVGEGGGNFEELAEMFNSSDAVNSHIVDLDSDGFLDFITVHFHLHKVNIHFGKGDGTFDTVVIEDVRECFGVASGDFDRDGDVDLAVVRRISRASEIDIFRNEGDRDLVKDDRSYNGVRDVIDIKSIDINNDQILDLVVVGYSRDFLTVLRGTDEGLFTVGGSISLGANPSWVEFVDFDGDALTDIIFSGGSDISSMYFLKGRGNGTFGDSIVLDRNGGVFRFLVADLNRDLIKDIVFTEPRQHRISVLLIDSERKVSQKLSFSSSTLPSYLQVADVNNDDLPDIFVSNEESESVSLIFNSTIQELCVDCNLNGLHDPLEFRELSSNADGWLGFIPDPLQISVDSEEFWSDASDVNGDGIIDFVIARTDKNDVVVLFGEVDNSTNSIDFNDSGNTYPVGDSPRHIITVDIDGDGDIDVLTANHESDDGSILLNSGGGEYLPEFRFSSGIIPELLSVSDLTGDGLIDIIAVTMNGDGGFFIQTGDREFSLLNEFSSEQPVIDFVVGDFDQDSQLDMVFAADEFGEIQFLKGFGEGTFDLLDSHSTHSNLVDINSFDINSDFKLDIITMHADGTVEFHLGEGDGTFLKSHSFNVGPNPKQMGVLEISPIQPFGIVITFFDGSVKVFTIEEGVNQKLVQSLSSPSTLGNIEFFDINKDQIPDLIGPSENQLKLYLGRGYLKDCNQNNVLDECELSSGFILDCNDNGIPDSCEIREGVELDCNQDGIPDSCNLASGIPDCDENGILDSCEINEGAVRDCNQDGIPDSCNISSGTPDCNENGVPDSCELKQGSQADCNGNGIPDSCEIIVGTEKDCNEDGIPDSCNISSGAPDCNGNGIPDSCEINSGFEEDCNQDGIPDSCNLLAETFDCNNNGVIDSCEISSGDASDVNGDGIPDECTQIVFLRGDANSDGIIDISDPIYSLRHSFLNKPAPECMKTADYDDNGVIEVIDAVQSLDYYFLGDNSGPSQPFPNCGYDPSDDGLTCESYSACLDR